MPDHKRELLSLKLSGLYMKMALYSVTREHKTYLTGHNVADEQFLNKKERSVRKIEGIHRTKNLVLEIIKKINKFD